MTPHEPHVVRAPHAGQPPRVLADGELALRVVTYNVRTAALDLGDRTGRSWPAGRRGIFARCVARLAPAVLCVQEAIHTQLMDIVGDLNTAAPHGAHYEFVGVARDDGARNGEYNAIIFDTTQLAVVHSDTFWLREPPAIHEPGPGPSWGAACRRICTYALLATTSKQPQQFFYVFNTHFDHEADQARYNAARLIVSQVVAALADYDDRARAFCARYSAIPMANATPPPLSGVIMTGDLNNWIETSPEILVLRGAGFIDTFLAMHPGATHNERTTCHQFTGDLGFGRRIDWVLVLDTARHGMCAPEELPAEESDAALDGWVTVGAGTFTEGLAVPRIEGCAIDRCAEDGVFPSDHFAVAADLVLCSPRASRVL